MEKKEGEPIIKWKIYKKAGLRTMFKLGKKINCIESNEYEAVNKKSKS